jgi:N-acetylglutamate synthase-like GNAT family acetyltransferase
LSANPPSSKRGSTYFIRKANEDDAQSIHTLVREAGINPLGLKWERFMVAVDPSDHVVGCGQLKPHRDGSLELASLAVRESWQGRGMGRALVEALIGDVETELWLMCRSSLTPLYEKFGFSEVGMDEKQPVYFRRVRRLASVFHMLAKTGEYLAVMVRR